MDDNLIWQQNSGDLNNADHLDAIASWWSDLNGKEVVWRQRLIPPSGDLAEIDWQPQKFDERVILQTPQLRGITIYWRSDKTSDERNITPSKLQLNPTKQELYIVPQSQSQVVISISLPGVVYQKLNLDNPQIAATTKDGCGIILLRDEAEKLEIKVTLDRDKLNLLRDRLQTEVN
ncbi:MAG: hypothetical protein QNJ72_21690 [Pleurocapsa sp. MO_226.B13]|nr:hypothetical protein [Pleurocapsa sp. MO_226.B13]